MGSVGLQTYIWNNNLRSVILLAGFPLLLVGMICALEFGAAVTGVVPMRDGTFNIFAIMLASVPAALAVAGIWFVIAYLFNQVIIDVATGAKKVERADEPELFNLLENLCISRGLTTPTLRVIETDGMNAFASGLHAGRFNVTVTRGLLNNLSKDELEAVLAHELTHIINLDVRTMVVAAVFAGIITLICQMIFRAIYWGSGGRKSKGGGAFILIALAIAALGYFLAIVIRMALSRSREFVADAGSVELTKNPDAMISALQKVSGHAHLDAPQSMRAMFLEDNEDGILGMFVTHPPIAKRIEALQKYAGGRLIEHPDPVAAASAPDAAPAGPWTAPAVDAAPSGPWS